MAAVVEADPEHLLRSWDARSEPSRVDRAIGVAPRGRRVELVQLGVPGDGHHGVGQGRVAGEALEVVPVAVALERCAAVDVDQSEHVAQYL